MTRFLSFIGHIMRELSAIILAGLIIYFFYFRSNWSPPPDSSVEYAFWACYFLFLYLAIQTGGIALTGVPNAMAMATDALVSVIPLLPLIYGMVDYYRDGLQLSHFQVLWAYAALLAILFDLVLNMTIMIRLSRRYLGEIDQP